MCGFLKFSSVLISGLILSWLKSISYMILILFNVLGLILWPSICFILVNIPWVLEKNACSCYLWDGRLSWLVVVFKSCILLLMFSGCSGLFYLFKIPYTMERKGSKSPTSSVEFSISSFDFCQPLFHVFVSAYVFNYYVLLINWFLSL
jgi:hypothetical protein